MALKKKYLKSKPVCKVSFILPKEAANSAKTVHLVGEFNEWDEDSMPMRKVKDGFTRTLDLEAGHEYQFRYLLDGEVWKNEHEADTYVFSEFGNCENSVVRV
ncbi:MAG: isoamylase early set domain-containing protein [Desulfovibrio sp.]|uniref:isoamylase early set domain-containing protein n=1 Tax=Desulfovibrio sp. 7SRBS1 TaxID=3378064 RepID=UPI003B3E55E5